MMRRYVFYHPQTGALHGSTLQLDVQNNAAYLENNTPNQYVAIEHDTAHPNTHRYDLTSGALMESRIQSPGADYIWDEQKKRWIAPPAPGIADAKELADLLREQQSITRDLLLGRSGSERLLEIDGRIKKLEHS
jgi:hypothetical protein